MTGRAAIYIRVSTAEQHDSYSPDEQERACRQKAEEHNLVVAKVYRDTQKYRVKSRLIEPSGTRADRPGLNAMLRDAKLGQFDVILAWREDRLYRGMRPMLTVLETIQEHKLEIILARETFDAKMTPVKAWVAGLELEAIRERVMMGQKGRLRQGKRLGGNVRYGYQPTADGDGFEIVEEEARWIRKIYDWYLEGVSFRDIRDHLIEGGAPQKGGPVPAKIPWSRPVIQNILEPKSAKEYALGIREVTFDGEIFTYEVPTILTVDKYQALLDKRAANKKNPTGALKNDYLIQGLLECPCGRPWGAHTRRRKTKTKGVTIRGAYYCTEVHRDQVHPDCPRSIGTMGADAYVWCKVKEVIDQPEILLGQAREYVAKLQASSAERQAEIDRLQIELDSLTMERQQVITWARKGRISEDDMEYQLSNLTLQEMSLRKEHAALCEVTSIAGLANWEQAVQDYFLALQAGMQELDATPTDPEVERRQFELKREIVKALVEKVIIGKGRKMSVVFRLDVLAILEKQGQNESIVVFGDRLSPTSTGS